MSKKPWICALCRSIVNTRLHAGRGQHVGDQLGRDRHARLVLAILARVAVIRHHRGDARRRRSTERVHHDHQLHQVLIDRRAGRLHDEDVGAADVLVDLKRDFGVGKPAQAGLTEFHPEELGNLSRELRMSTAREDFQFSETCRSHDRCECNENWLGRKDSNLRIPAPKAGALPLGHAPTPDAAPRHAALTSCGNLYEPSAWSGLERRPQPGGAYSRAAQRAGVQRQPAGPRQVVRGSARRVSALEQAENRRSGPRHRRKRRAGIEQRLPDAADRGVVARRPAPRDRCAASPTTPASRAARRGGAGSFGRAPRSSSNQP